MLRKSWGILFAVIAAFVPLSLPLGTTSWLSGAALATAHTGNGNGATGRTGGSADNEGSNDRLLELSRRAGSGNTGYSTIEVVPAPPAPVRTTTPIRPRTPVRPVVLPDRALHEIVTLDLGADDLTTLEAQGFTVVAETELAVLGLTSRRLRVPRGISDSAALDLVRALPTGADSDFNHFYRPGQGPAALCNGVECAARVMIGWPVSPERGATCGQGVTVGMVDSAINMQHVTFNDAGLELHRLTRDGLRPSRAVHGTAVAALLVGNPRSRSPGLVPGARLVAVDAFFRVGADERADVHGLAEGLDLLAQNKVRVINLSLAGAENRVLARLIDKLTGEFDVVIVAAVGNAGPKADPQYPAAYGAVLAVTAVDRGLGLYNKAVRGGHVDMAAPGVEVWTAASVKGATWRTGTSFAAPFVTAAAAMLRQSRPDLSMAEITDVLRGGADDLGAPGADDLFGAGLLRIGDLCDVTP